MNAAAPSEMTITYARVRSAKSSDRGYARETNEDCALIFEPTPPEVWQRQDKVVDAPDLAELLRGNIYVVADGVGGLENGEDASKRAVEDIIQAYLTAPSPAPLEALRHALTVANQQIYQAGPSGPGTMATTVVCAVVVGRELYVAHVGDSRAYVLRQGEEVLRTVDHSWKLRVQNDPAALAEFRRRFNREQPRGNEIIYALGRQPTVPIAEAGMITEQPFILEPGDRILLCTDGLWDPVAETTLRQRLIADDDPAEVCQQLVREALDAGGPDNVTVLVVLVDGFADYTFPAHLLNGALPAPASPGPLALAAHEVPINGASGTAPGWPPSAISSADADHTDPAHPDTVAEDTPAPQEGRIRLPILLTGSLIMVVALAVLVGVVILGWFRPTAETSTETIRAQFWQSFEDEAVLRGLTPEEVQDRLFTVLILSVDPAEREHAATAIAHLARVQGATVNAHLQRLQESIPAAAQGFAALLNTPAGTEGTPPIASPTQSGDNGGPLAGAMATATPTPSSPVPTPTSDVCTSFRVANTNGDTLGIRKEAGQDKDARKSVRPGYPLTWLRDAPSPTASAPDFASGTEKVEWYQVRDESDGVVGWVSKRYLVPAC